MADISEKISAVANGILATLEKNGFAAVPSDSDTEFTFSGEKGTVRIRHEDDKIYLLASELPCTEAKEESYVRLALSLLDDDSRDSDIKYIASDFSETLNDRYSKKVIKKNTYRAPSTVSKAAVREGMSYDANTLASRLCSVYPELKTVHKSMLEKYRGEFPGEEFFSTYISQRVVETVKKNDPMTMKKLFNILNEIYEDGTNDVQDAIAVTILGELNNDTELLANCVDYMSETMAPVVIAVNKYLATGSGKRMKKKLLNPPPYKPKKEKKSLMSRLMDTSSLQQ